MLPSLKEEFKHVGFKFFFFWEIIQNNILTKWRISILDQDVTKLAFYIRRILLHPIFLLWYIYMYIDAWLKRLRTLIETKLFYTAPPLHFRKKGEITKSENFFQFSSHGTWDRVKWTIALSMRGIWVTTIHPVKNVNQIRWPRSIIEFSLRILANDERLPHLNC